MLTQSEIPLESERLLGREIGNRETLLWVGRPDPARLARQTKNIAFCLFGIPWTLGALTWEYMVFHMLFGWPDLVPPPMGVPLPHASQNPLNLLFPVVGLLFVLAGLWMLSFPYRAGRKALQTVYAVTDTRAVIMEPGQRGRTVTRSISPEYLADRTCTRNKDGYGTLIFDRLTARHHAVEGATMAVTVGFERIADVKAVDYLIGRTFPAGAQ